ncbi:glycoside hydrolase family 113 [Sphingomonas sp.]|uniref:glycoside hydrolase family 113 n=1 Tax=Sphingomonas sp. TaxID=28214 RepID=UPI003B002D31
MTQLFDTQGIVFNSGNDNFASAETTNQLKALAATGANTVSIVGRNFQSALTSNSFIDQPRTTDLSVLGTVIDNAHAAGLKVTITPHLDLPIATDRSKIVPTDIAQWFKNYTALIVDYAKTAQAHGAEMLSLGTEMDGVLNASTTGYWNDLIAQVRAVYSGKLTYQAGPNTTGDVPFWDKLDVISTDAYVAVATSTTPTVDDVVKAWNTIPTDEWMANKFDSMSPIDFYKSLSEKYGKPIEFGEIGYRNVDGAGTHPGDFSVNMNFDDAEQATLYQGLFKAFAGESSWFSGVNAFDWTSTDMKWTGGKYHLAGSAALPVIEQWFSGANNATAGKTVSGTVANETLTGGSGDDVLRGGAGADLLAGGRGNDLLDGDGGGAQPTGTMTVYASGTAAAGVAPIMNVLVNGKVIATTTVAADGASHAFTFDIPAGTSPSAVALAFANDYNANGEDRNLFIQKVVVNGTTLDQSLATNAKYPGTFSLKSNGQLGFDLASRADIMGGALSGNDTLNGGEGSDTVTYASALGGVAVDLGKQGAAQDTVGAGRDTLTGIENLIGSQFADVLTGDANANVIAGNGGGDSIDGKGGNDLLIGGDGKDAFTVSAGNGSDTIQAFTPGSDVIHLNGYGLDSFEKVKAIATQSGSDTMLHMANGETLTLSGVTLTSLTPADFGLTLADTIRTTLANYTLDAVSHGLTFVGVGATTLIGNALDNIITGGSSDDVLKGMAGNDTLIGGGGNDTLDGGTGNDRMEGGAGNDTYLVDAAGDTVIEAAGGGTDTVKTTLGATSLAANVENLTFVGTGDATLIGNELANLLTGGAGNDRLDGGTGIDTIAGGLGNDTYVVDATGDVVTELAGQGNDTILTSLSTYKLDANVENLTYTGTANATLTGNELDNILTGGSGNDTLNGGAGHDTLAGGAGDDLYIVDAPGGAIVEAANGGLDTVKTSLATYTLAANVENLVYTGTGVATLTGNASDNVITAGALGGTLSGGAGNDTLNGGNGDDRLDGGTGDDVMQGGAGNDTYVVDSAGDQVVEAQGKGTDTVLTTSANTTLASNVENLTYIGNGEAALTGNTLANLITGGAGNDTLTSVGGNDTLTGGAGNDTYVVTSLADKVVEAANGGNDTIRTAYGTYTLGANVENLAYTGTANATLNGNELDNIVTGGAGNDKLFGMAGNDTLVGGGGNDVFDGGTGNDLLQAGAGDDTLDGGVGQDTLDGGAGNDVYIVDGAGDVVIEAAGAGTDTVKTTLLAYTLAANAENLTYTGTGTATLTGNQLDNVVTAGATGGNLYGGAGDDTLVGGNGNDLLDGGTGADVMKGGAGDDIYFIDSIGDVVVEDAGKGTDTVKTTLATYTLAAGLENLTFVGAGDATLTGNYSANVITGGAGNDLLTSVGGNDTLVGGAGDDTYVVSSLTDVVREDANGGLDTIKTGLLTYTLANNVENLTFTGTSGATMTGNALDNVITGGTGGDKLYGLAGNDTLVGGAGHDTIDGGTGNDTMIGGTDNDTYYVDAVGDRVVEAANEGTDTVKTTLASYTLADNVEKLEFAGSGNATLIGNALANLITGGNGNDVLRGGGGADTLTGGLGADKFAFLEGDLGTANGSTQTVTIADFNHAQGDKIDLSGIDANKLAGGDQAFTWHANGNDHVAGAMWLTQYQDTTFVNLDTDGDGKGDYFLRVMNKGVALAATDFVL